MAPSSSKQAVLKSEPEKRSSLPDLDPVLETICRDILSLKDESPIVLALKENAILDFPTLISMPDKKIEQLTVKEKGVPTQLLQGYSASQILWFKKWCAHLRDQAGGQVPEPEEIAVMDRKDFTKFRVSSALDDPIPPAPHTVTPIIQASKTVDPVADFKRSIKRDASLYPNLKDHRQWNNWKRAVLAQANAHDIQEVFDPNYKASTTEEQALF